MKYWTDIVIFFPCAILELLYLCFDRGQNSWMHWSVVSMLWYLSAFVLVKENAQCGIFLVVTCFVLRFMFTCHCFLWRHCYTWLLTRTLQCIVDFRTVTVSDDLSNTAHYTHSSYIILSFIFSFVTSLKIWIGWQNKIELSFA